MNGSNRIEVSDEIGQCRLMEPHGLRQAIEGVTAAISTAREQGLRKLLVVIAVEALAFEPPGVAERHAMVREWAEASQGMVRVAIVVPLTFIDPEKFGVIAAANFGLASNAFSSETEAMAWLREPH